MIESVFMRVIAPTLLALLLVSDIACSGSPQSNSAGANSPQANPDQWQPVTNIPGAFRRNLVSDPRQPGPFKYQLKIPGGARAAAHQHSKDVHVKVLSGSMFIIIGEPLESSPAQRRKGAKRYRVFEGFLCAFAPLREKYFFPNKLFRRRLLH